MGNNNDDYTDEMYEYEYEIERDNRTNTEYIKIDTENEGIQKIKIYDPPEDEYSLSMYNKIEKFDENAWSTDYGLKSGFKNLDEVFNGWNEGFYVIGGDSNLGKSGFISQLAHQAISNNKDTYVLDFSLDDGKDEKIPRIIASKYRVPINAVRKPKMYKNNPAYQTMMARREKGLAKLRSWAIQKKYMLFDSSEVLDIEMIENETKKFITQVSAGKKKRPNIVVMIDSYHDLISSSKSKEYYNNKWEYLAIKCSKIAENLKIVLIVTAELKKINGNRRPIQDDLREAIKLRYEAKAIMLVYNEVHYKQENASIYYTRLGENLKQPVFEVNVVKNKFNSRIGVLFYNFLPEYALFQEADEIATQQYTSALYGSEV